MHGFAWSAATATSNTKTASGVARDPRLPWAYVDSIIFTLSAVVIGLGAWL